MTEAEILKTTYWDTLSVYRPYAYKVNGETLFKKGTDGKCVYDSVPCALSRAGMSKANKTETDVKVSHDYNLFVTQQVEIEPNDTLVVTHLGKAYTLTAGAVDRQISHNRVPCNLVKGRA